MKLIAAHDRARCIGLNNQLPWRLPNDLQQFKRLTLDHTVLMGRKTWESLGRPLPQRENWVLTRDPHFRAEGARVFHDLDQALAAAPMDLFIIGGGQLYAETLPLAHTLHLTWVDTLVAGDAFFPDYQREAYVQTFREDHALDARHAFAYSFVTLERRHAKGGVI
jgi:dihydrofolate reductase